MAGVYPKTYDTSVRPVTDGKGLNGAGFIRFGRKGEGFITVRRRPHPWQRA